MSTLLVVRPEQEVSAVTEYLSQSQSMPVEVMAKENLVPDLRQYPKLRCWRKRQLVKLAASRVLASDYCFTFATEVLGTRLTNRSELLPVGEALLQHESRALYQPLWFSSTSLLCIDQAVGDSYRGMSITLTLLTRDLLKTFTDALSKRRVSSAERLCRSHPPWSPPNWTPARFRCRWWTEYSLYNLFAPVIGAFDGFNIERGPNHLLQALLGHEAYPFKECQPACAFSSADPVLCCLVDITPGLSPRVIWAAVRASTPG